MELLLVVVGLLIALALTVAAWQWQKSKTFPRDNPPTRPQFAPPAPDHSTAARRPRPAPAVAPHEPAPLATVREMPPELAAFKPLRAKDLPRERRDRLTEVFHDVPRPPRLLDHLLSPDFVRTASSAELADLIAADPLIAARLLAAINSPLYGLRTPVGSIEQAVTLLGLASVRSICLQYLLIASFEGDSDQRRAALADIWNASALASELAHRLAQRLEMHDAGSLVSAVVLSFLGRLATAARMPLGLLATIPTASLLERSRAEQDSLGSTASEIGRLLMTQWALPADVVDDAASVDSVLVTGDDAWEPVHASRRALAYLCARLGERLAQGQLASAAAFDLEGDNSPDFFHLQSYLGNPGLAHLGEHLAAPELDEQLRKMLGHARPVQAEPATA
jgi:HD-like signal output (HDOD) protein